MLLEIDPAEPEPWLVAKAVATIRRAGLFVTPTDTVYALACPISNEDAIARLYEAKGLDPKKPLSVLVPDLGTAGPYMRGVSTQSFRMMKRLLPGPFTFIVEASREVPRIMLRRRKTIGIRIPDQSILLALLVELGEPLLATSIWTPEDQVVNDPEEIESRLQGHLELVIDGGPLLPEPSTVVDLTGEEPVLVRRGKGDPALLGLA